MENKLLKIAGILYGLSGVLLLDAPIYGIILILIGIYFYIQGNESRETIYKNRVLHYILTAIGIVNWIGFILVFVAQDEIKKEKRREKNNLSNAPPKVKIKVDKEARKIDLLLKLGVFMVFVSGLLFATTSWSFISNTIKALALVLFGILFLVLSLFTEIKLKLYRSSYMYWLLSISLFILTIVGILYFGIFGTYLTYNGEGSRLAYAITFLSTAAFALTTYYKFPKKYLLFTCYGGVILSLASLFAYLNFSQMMVLSIISLVVFITNLVDHKKGKVMVFTKILSYLLIGFFLLVNSDNSLDVALAVGINILNINYLTFIDNRKDEATINVILTYILMLFGIFHIDVFKDYAYITTALFMTIYTLIINGNVIETKRFTQRFNYLFYSIAMFILTLFALGNEVEVLMSCIAISVIQLLMNIIVKRGLWRIESWDYANYMTPLMIIMTYVSVINYFPVLDTTFINHIAILSVLFAVLNLLYNEKPDKGIYFVYAFIFTIIGLLIPHEYKDIYACLALIITALYLFTTSYIKENDKSLSKLKTNLSYILLLSTIYIPFVADNVLELNIFIPALIFIVLVFIIAPLLRSDWIKKISYLYIILPLRSIIELSGVDYPIQVVLENITGFYVVILLIKFFIKNDLARNIVLLVGVLLFCLEPFFLDHVLGGVFVGIVGLYLIIYGYRKDKSFYVFVTGIVLTIINIVYRLREVWKMIPFWLYLLVGGLFIIGFVTYRELAKQKEENTKSK